VCAVSPPAALAWLPYRCGVIFAKTGPAFGHPETSSLGDVMAGVVVVVLVVALFVALLGGVDRVLSRLFGPH
jgi:hypothetical protein